MRVAVLDDYHRIAHTLADWGSLGVEVAFFDRPLAREQLPEVLAEFDTLVLMRERTAFPREVLERLPDLELVVTTGMRNASLDVDYLKRARRPRLRHRHPRLRQLGQARRCQRSQPPRLAEHGRARLGADLRAVQACHLAKTARSAPGSGSRGCR